MSKEIIAVCSEMHTEHINTIRVCGKKVYIYIYLNFKPDIAQND